MSYTDGTLLGVPLPTNNYNNTFTISILNDLPSHRCSFLLSLSLSLLNPTTSPIPLLPFSPLPILPTVTSAKLLLRLAVLSTITLPVIADFGMVMMMIYNTTLTIPIPQTPPQ